MAAITWGHIVALAGVADLVGAAIFTMNWARVNGHPAGTPLYARARAARRLAILSTASGLVLLAIGTLTPLWQLEVV